MATIAEVRIKGSGGSQAAKELDRVGKSTETLGRQQTRLGQASASAGRQFSAQASGLGGLVGAYAGAAATVFALTAAFQALNNAARFQQIIDGTNALASSLGLQGTAVLANIQRITKGQLTLAETAQSANIALSAGLNQDQIEGLTEVATRASRALGRPLTDAFNRLTRGVAKLEPELLDELGIFTRIEPAAEAYAKSIGKVASQLTNFERRQAFANEAITEGISKFKDVDLESTTAAENLEKLSATVLNIGTQIGLFVANFLNPLVEIFGSGLPAAFLVASLGRLVFGKALEELTGLVESSRNKVIGLADTLTNKLAKAARVGATETRALSAATQTLSLNQTRGAAADKTRFNELVKLARQNKITADQAGELVVATEKQQKLDKLRITALNSKSSLTSKENAELARLNTREKELIGTRQKAIAVQNAQSASLVRLNKVLRAGASAAVTFGKGLLSVLNIFVLVTTVASIIGAIGSAVLDALGILDDFVAVIKEVIEGYRELLGLSSQDILGRQTIKDIAATLNLTGIQGFSQVQEAIRDVFVAGGYRSAEAFTEALAERLGVSAEKVTQAVGDIINEIVDTYKNLDENSSQLVGDLAASLGRGAGQTAKLLEFDSQGVRAAESTLLTYNNQLKEAGDTSTKLGKEQRAIAQATIQSQLTQIELIQAIEKGTLRVEALDKLRAASTNRITQLQQLLGQTTDKNLQRELRLQILLAQLEDNRLRTLSDRQILIAQNTDAIRKQFSAELRNADKLSSILRIQQDGSISLAETQREQRTIQIQQLQEALQRGYSLLEQQRDGVTLRDEQVKLAEGAEVAERALLGLFVKTAEELKKINKELEKRNASLSTQISDSLLKLDLINSRESLKLLQDSEKLTRLALKRQQERVELAKQRLDLERKTADAIKDAERSVTESFNSQFSSLLGSTASQDLEISIAEQDLAELRRRVDEEQKLLSENSVVQANLNRQLQANLDNQIASLEEIAKGEREVAQNRIDATIKTLELEKQAIDEKFELIKLEASAFDSHIDGLARILAADLTSRRQLQMSTGQFAQDVGVRTADASPSQVAQIRGVVGRTRGLEGTSTDPMRLGRQVQNAALNSMITPGQLREIDMILSQVDIPTIIKDKISTPSEQASEALATFGDNIKSLRTVLETLADAENAAKLDDQIRSLTDKIRDAQSEIVKLGTAEGERVNELKSGIIVMEEQLKALKAVRSLNSEYNRSILAVGESVQDSVSGGLEDLFQTIADGEFTLKNASAAFNSFLKEVVEGIRKQLLAKTLIEPLSEGIGNAFKGALNTEGTGNESFFGSLFGGKASGGLVHMAGGGQVRDRVPAMLEPGEFVIRKPMAKAIGGPVLNSMNATGSMPTGDVSVNITNTGTPQQATASQPRFDGEKMVVDIVMRDLRNNGPIRKSLRGGA